MTEKSLSESVEAASTELTHEEASVARTYVEQFEKLGIVSIAQLVETVSDATAKPDLRDMACALLVSLRIRTATPVLAHALAEAEDDDGFVWTAANALVRLRGGGATSTLLEVLERGNPEKQAATAWVLGWVGDPSAIPSLRIAAMDPRRPVDVRAHATEALGVLHAREALSDLIALLTSESPELRYWAAYSLGQIADPASQPELERVASTDVAVLSNDRSVRQEALDALAAIRAREGRENTQS